jgi:glucosamine--fructose-6-phosphate aminotransferase (isomerizing)
MEYRGYDSAGIATISKGKLLISRASGKLDNLKTKLEEKSHSGSIGIGHTRWATHGGPSERNAHPHRAGTIALIHNGIIENYEELRNELKSEGVKFSSDTDTEVLAHLINKKYTISNSLETAVYEALARVRGAFGIVVMSANEPLKLVAARRGSPIVIGLANQEVYIASDPTALAGWADEVIFLGEDEVAVCTPGNVQITDLKQIPKEYTPQKLEIEVQALQKEGYDHFLLKEIMEQPKSIESILRGHLLADEGEARLGGLNLSDEQIRQISRIQIVACGTAYYAGLLAKYQIERMAKIPVDVDVASEFRYREPVLDKNILAIVISQSGETADTLASLHELKRQNIHVLGLVNVVGSTIAREVDGGVYLHAGPEISVASTKAFTSQVLAAMLVGLFIARKRGLSVTIGKQIVSAMQALPSEVKNALKLNAQIKKDAKKLGGFNNALYLGRDTLFPIALEGALKLKEISYIHAEGYSSGEMKHGPIALIDKNFLTVNLLGKGPLMEKSISNLQEVRARGGYEYIVSDDESLKESLYVKTSSPWTAPLVINVVLQMLAYHIAVSRGTDVDQPRNLAKSVTVE